jgi:alpha-beta hydrolase superfamily lysophospholipase
LPIIPIAPLPPKTMSTLADKQQTYDTDPLIFHGQMAAGTGKELLMASMYISQRLHKVSVPFLALQGQQDTLVTGSEQLYQQASSQDKTLKSYDALHDLLNDKPAEQVMTDIIEWLEVRVVVHH